MSEINFLTDKFDAIKFIMAEKLSQELWNRSPKKIGLVAVLTKVGSVPKDTVVPVEGTPLDFINEIADKEGIDENKINELIKSLQSEDIKINETGEQEDKIKSGTHEEEK